MTGQVHSLEPFGAFDGPGIRGVIFLQGCMMRCRYCHNPDTWDRVGTSMAASDIMARLKSYFPYYRTDCGGITVSGGEPLLQPDFTAEIFELAHGYGLTTALDTSGFNTLPDGKIEMLLSHTDYLLLDIKSANPVRHIWLTGQPLEGCAKVLRCAHKLNVKTIVRHVLVPGITDSDQDLRSLSEIVSKYDNIVGCELLPYHKMGLHKWKALGMTNSLSEIDEPTAAEMETAEKLVGLA